VFQVVSLLPLKHQELVICSEPADTVQQLGGRLIRVLNAIAGIVLFQTCSFFRIHTQQLIRENQWHPPPIAETIVRIKCSWNGTNGILREVFLEISAPRVDPGNYLFVSRVAVGPPLLNFPATDEACADQYENQN